MDDDVEREEEEEEEEPSGEDGRLLSWSWRPSVMAEAGGGEGGRLIMVSYDDDEDRWAEAFQKVR